MSPSLLEANKNLAMRFLELAARYEADACLALMSGDVTWWVAGDPARLKDSGILDRPKIARLLKGMARALREPLSLMIVGVTAEGHRVAIEATGTGVWRSGAPFFNSYHFLFEVRNGKVTTLREYMDTLRVFDMTQRQASAGDAR